MTGENGPVLALSGGVGGAKLALGLCRILPSDALTVVANTGDDFEHLGLSISPDLDTLLYTLSGQANPELGWGRDGETWTFMAALEALGDARAAASFDAERAVVAALGGGCELPLGAIAVHANGALDLQAIVTSPDGSRVVRAGGTGDPAQPAELGRRVADELARGGAMEILKAVR